MSLKSKEIMTLIRFDVMTSMFNQKLLGMAKSRRVGEHYLLILSKAIVIIMELSLDLRMEKMLTSQIYCKLDNGTSQNNKKLPTYKAAKMKYGTYCLADRTKM